MRKLAFRFVTTTTAVAAFAVTALAGGLTNNFDGGFDFVANGIIGQTNWDGVYLGFGDVPGGDNGGDGDGATISADETEFPGFLSVETVNSSWSAAGDDGFFAYKVVRGDFDASVQSAPIWNAQNYNFAGIMARLYNPNNSGSPFSTTSTNASENWATIWRFQEFGINEVRFATNGVNDEITFPEDNSDTNTTRYYRIQRINDITFNFFTKTNQSDDWALMQSLSRPDWSGLPVQVGIAQATFTGNTPQDYFTDFELTGTNVNFPTLPPAPSGLITTATNIGGSLTFSWTKGSAGDGSLVVVRTGGNIQNNPVNGISYVADASYGDTNTLLGGAGEYVVYSGAGNSVTVTNLAGTNTTYTIAVFEYSGSGISTVYNTAGPITGTHVGPGIPNGVVVYVLPNSLPVGGAAISQIFATFSSGPGLVDETASPETTWSSSAPGVATAVNGAVNGVGVGTCLITGTFAGLGGSQSVSVHAPAFTDDFSVPKDYLNTGLAGLSNATSVAGSTWDGIYLKYGDIPNGNNGGGPGGASVAFDAGVTTNAALTITAHDSGWEGAEDDGPFLFKNVPGGDFQASVHITDYTHPAYQFVGLQARAFDPAHGGPGGPDGLAAENHVNWWRFDQYGVTSSARETLDDNLDVVNDQVDNDTVDYWLLMSRVNGTNFYFFKKQNLTDPWTFVNAASIVRADLTNGVPLQVGLAQGTYTDNAGTVQFDSFMLDATNISGGTPPSASYGLTEVYDATNNSITLTWVAGTNSDGSASTSFVVMRQGAPVSAQPTFGILTTADATFGLGSDLGSGNYVVFRGVGNTVTVTGLTPGSDYYAAVYGYSGSSATKSFNEAGSGASSVSAGNVTNIVASLNGSIPLGGVGLPVVLALFDSGGTADVSGTAVAISTNSSVIIATNDVLTGVGLGTTWIQVTASGYTSSFPVTVRAPGFTENFNANHDYVASGISGTHWDGVYASVGSIPGTTFVSDPAASIVAADANVTSNETLTVSSENVGWEFGQDDGFFLYKFVPGDFQAAVHVGLDPSQAAPLGYNNPGLLARAYGFFTNGTIGAPIGGTNGAESWVSWTRFDQFGIGSYARLTITNTTTRSTQPDAGDLNLWLLMVRANGTNFSFYQRAVPTDPWAPAPAGTTYQSSYFAGLPLQVGLLAGGFDSGNIVVDQFDSFMLDLEALQLQAVRSGNSLILSWPAASGATLQSTLSLSPASWQTVSGTPVTVNGVNSLTVPLTKPASFYRLAE